METSKVFIYCRVLSEEARSLLEYQEDVLREYADMLDIEVFAVAREIGSGKHFGSRGMEKLIYYVVNEKINIIFVYDKTESVFMMNYLLNLECFVISMMY